MSRSLERRLGHDSRLDVLCCLRDGPLSLTALSLRLEKSAATVAYHLDVLEGGEVVKRSKEQEGDEVVYVATLDDHPPWLREAVADHKGRDRDQAAAVTSLRRIVGMRCDGCERLLRYDGPVVALYEEEGERWAEIVAGRGPETGETPRPKSRSNEKFHHDCYLKARNLDEWLPPIR